MRWFGFFAKSDEETPQQTQVSVWDDKFGRLTTRCIQTLALLALSALGLFLIVQLRLVLVPVIVALILASALNPIMRKFRAELSPRARRCDPTRFYPRGLRPHRLARELGRHQSMGRPRRVRASRHRPTARICR